MKFKDELPKPTLATSGAIGLAFTASAPPRTLGSEHPPDLFFGGVFTGSQKQRNGGAPYSMVGLKGSHFVGPLKKTSKYRLFLGHPREPQLKPGKSGGRDKPSHTLLRISANSTPYVVLGS